MTLPLHPRVQRFLDLLHDASKETGIAVECSILTDTPEGQQFARYRFVADSNMIDAAFEPATPKPAPTPFTLFGLTPEQFSELFSAKGLEVSIPFTAKKATPCKTCEGEGGFPRGDGTAVPCWDCGKPTEAP